MTTHANKAKGSLMHFTALNIASVIEKFQGEMSAYDTPKGTVHFPLDKPIPYELIKKLCSPSSGKIWQRLLQNGKAKMV